LTNFPTQDVLTKLACSDALGVATFLAGFIGKSAGGLAAEASAAMSDPRLDGATRRSA